MRFPSDLVDISKSLEMASQFSFFEWLLGWALVGALGVILIELLTGAIWVAIVGVRFVFFAVVRSYSRWRYPAAPTLEAEEEEEEIEPEWAELYDAAREAMERGDKHSRQRLQRALEAIPC